MGARRCAETAAWMPASGKAARPSPCAHQMPSWAPAMPCTRQPWMKRKGMRWPGIVSMADGEPGMQDTMTAEQQGPVLLNRLQCLCHHPVLDAKAPVLCHLGVAGRCQMLHYCLCEASILASQCLPPSHLQLRAVCCQHSHVNIISARSQQGQYLQQHRGAVLDGDVSPSALKAPAGVVHKARLGPVIQEAGCSWV